MEVVTAYECSYCNKIYKIKSSAKRHEDKCFANPKTKACRTCVYAIKDTNTIYVPPHGDQNYGDGDYEQDFIYCKITDKLLSHPEKACSFEYRCPYYKQGEKLF